LPSVFDWIRLQALIYEESWRIQDIVLERVIAPALRASRQPDGQQSARSVEAKPDPREAAVVEMLRRAQILLLRYPIAAQAAFAALVAEGRRFAETPEGAAWRDALASSDLLRSGRRVWDAVSFNMLEDNPGTIIPSAYLEALLRAAKTADIDSLLQALHDVVSGGARAAAR
jgi:hypothetical protein